MDRRPSMPHLFSLLAAFLAITVGMGLLSAGIFIPAVWTAGAAAKGSVQAFNDLPADFTASPLAQQSRIVDTHGKTIATPYDENRIIVPLRKIAPIMQKAQIAIEDSRFYEHGGLDLRGTLRALVNNLRGGQTQGGSSLTQQYVKITLQEKALKNGNEQAAQAAVASTGLKGYARKLQELKYAINLEKTMTKKQILEGYLNLVYYGDQAYGIEAASLHYFSVHAKDLNLAQAATLAGVVRAPSILDPHDHPQAAQQRRDVVIDRMLQLGMITKKQAKRAKAKSVEKMLKLKDNQGGTCVRSSEPYFCEYIMSYLKKMPALGKNEDERIRNINQGGLLIKTTLNGKWQNKILKQLTRKVPIGDPSRVGAAASVVEPGTGKVLAMVQSSKFTPTANKSTVGATAVNWNVPIEYGGTDGFQFGSTAKVFATIRALQTGTPVNGTIPSRFASTTKAAIYYPNEYADGCKSLTPYSVHNDYPAGGQPIPLKTALSQSINSAFASLVITKLGVCAVQKTMTQMHLIRGDGSEIQKYPAPVVLGADTVPPLTMAASYAAIAADGKYCAPDPIEWIKTNDGKKLKIPGPQCNQVISKDVARGTTQIMEGVLKNGTGAGDELAGGRVAAGKTGTTDNYMQSWFAGFTPQLSTAVWVGTPEVQHSMKNIKIGGTFYPRVFGSTIAAPLWKEIMDMASSGTKKESFKKPSNKIEYGDRVPIPNVVGQSVQHATSVLKSQGFNVQVAGQVSSSIPTGLVASMNPTGSAPQGTTIALYTSTGSIPQPTQQTTPPGKTKTPPPRTRTTRPRG